MVDKTRTKAYRNLRKALFDALEKRGMTEPVWVDKAEEYLVFWTQLQDLNDDITDRGVTVFDEKREMRVENRSVSLALQVSRQMLAILQALGIDRREVKREAPPDEL